MLMKHNLFKGVLLTMTLVILYSCTSESPSNTDNVQQTRVQQIKDDQAVQLGEELYITLFLISLQEVKKKIHQIILVVLIAIHKITL